MKKTDFKHSVILEEYTPAGGAPKKHIAVLAGGMSAEREVSLSSANSVLLALKELGYRFTAIDMGRDIAKILEQIKPDVVFNALHGGYGENGSLAGLLEIMAIPYTHSGLSASAIAMNKILSKEIFKQNGIKCAQDMIVNKSDNYQEDPMERPYVIKPIGDGSSFGVEVIFAEDEFKFKDYKFAYGDQILIEKYIPGREIQVAVLGDKAIGAIEVVPKGRFYDYEAKYTEGMATHIMPAPLDEKAHSKLLALAYKAHYHLGCRGVSRVDFRYDEQGDGEFYILELNSHPGLTPISLAPEIAAYYGTSFPQLIEYLIQEARLEHSQP